MVTAWAFTSRPGLRVAWEPGQELGSEGRDQLLAPDAQRLLPWMPEGPPAQVAGHVRVVVTVGKHRNGTCLTAQRLTCRQIPVYGVLSVQSSHRLVICEPHESPQRRGIDSSLSDGEPGTVPGEGR